jgi:hypothetical protein
MAKPVPIPSSSYGSADEESNRVFRKRQGTLPGTRVGLPGRSDSSQDRRGNWVPGPIRKKKSG